MGSARICIIMFYSIIAGIIIILSFSKDVLRAGLGSQQNSVEDVEISQMPSAPRHA